MGGVRSTLSVVLPLLLLLLLSAGGIGGAVRTEAPVPSNLSPPPVAPAATGALTTGGLGGAVRGVGKEEEGDEAAAATAA